MKSSFFPKVFGAAVNASCALYYFINSVPRTDNNNNNNNNNNNSDNNDFHNNSNDQLDIDDEDLKTAIAKSLEEVANISATIEKEDEELKLAIARSLEEVANISATINKDEEDLYLIIEKSLEELANNSATINQEDEELKLIIEKSLEEVANNNVAVDKEDEELKSAIAASLENSSSSSTINSDNNGNGTGNDPKEQEQQQEKDQDQDQVEVENEYCKVLPKAKKVIYGQKELCESMEWKRNFGIGCGLNNIGNTCYMNSVLQCLTYSPALANYMFKGEHSRNCPKVNGKGFCIFCSLETHINKCHSTDEVSIDPTDISNNIKKVAPLFTIGCQEDAHEFIRCLIDSLQTECISSFPKGSISEHDSMTSVIGSIFGGYLQNQLKCPECHHESITFDPFMDLSVDIEAKEVKSLPMALRNFVKPEIIDGYTCSSCMKKVEVSKRLQVELSPPILSIQMKRFNNYGLKIDKYIEFDSYLDMSPFMAQKNASIINIINIIIDHSMYDLHAVLVHSGSSSNCGHYYCYVKGTNNGWYLMNDSMVSHVPLWQVLNSNAYMLFYSKRYTKHSINANSIGTNGLVDNKRRLDYYENEFESEKKKLKL